ncbi:MAG TPA: regulatory protein RecX [Clostridiales bacterium]|nr:regulatory protein RecX [Clostridiales bacterium]HRT82116.1 regulatory protein RecX [Oscillospiraceae bacterium]
MILTGKLGKNGKMHVYADDEYILSVTPEFWYSQGISNGSDIDDESYESFLADAKVNFLYEKALNLLSFRDHSAKELEDKLSRFESREFAKSAVEKVRSLGLLNDEAFAQKYANELRDRKNFSNKRIFIELIQKGIDRDTADRVASSFDDESERLESLIERKYSNALKDEKSKRRAFNALLRLGYSYSDIKSAFNLVESDAEEFY